MRSTFLLFSVGFDVVFHFCVKVVLIVLLLLVNDCCLAPQLFPLNYDNNKYLFNKTITSALYRPRVHTKAHWYILCYHYVIQQQTPF